MRIRLILLCLIVAIGCGATAVISASDRDSLPYRAASKLIFPISKLFVAAAPDTAGKTVAETLQTMPRSWRWFQRELVESSHGSDGLKLRPKIESVWWKNKRGPLLYTNFNGDLEAQVTISTRKQSDPQAYPDRAYQFGGLIVRDPRGNAWFSQEAYVFIAVGHRGKGLQIESKSTYRGYSTVTGVDWKSGNAKVKISRQGRLFRLFAFEEEKQDWRLVQTFEQELPVSVQVGVFAYAYSAGKGIVDIVARFQDFEVRPLE